MTEIVLFPGVNPEVVNQKYKTDDVLRGAINLGLKNVMVIGMMSDGQFYIASSSGNVAEDHYLLSRVQHKMMVEQMTNYPFKENGQPDIRSDEQNEDDGA